MTISMMPSRSMGNRTFLNTLRAKLYRYRCAISYLRGRLTPEEGQYMIHELDPIAGWYSLSTLCVEDVLDLAERRWGSDPELIHLCNDAARSAAREYQSSDGLLWAQERALDLVKELASERGVVLRAFIDEATK